MPERKLTIRAAGVSHVGMKRKQNQDSYALKPELNLFVVADGMGGHRGGETASALAVETVVGFFSDPSSRALPPIARMQKAMLTANAAIQARGNSEPGLQGMGTTMVVLHFFESSLYIGHVGDSRCYLLHPDRIWQVTRDHSLVQEKLRAGLITRTQIKTDRMKNVITRSVGFDSELEVDVYVLEPNPGDHYVICSDGLSGMVDDPDIAKTVWSTIRAGRGLESVSAALIEQANAGGGDDNVTAVVIQVS